MDYGKEFYNKTIEDLLQVQDILIYSIHNDEKASVVERWNNL